MRSRHASAVSVAAVAMAIALAGCSHRPPPALPVEPATTSTTPTSPPPSDTAVPAPQALAEVLYRLADPAVPGAEKVDLIEGANPDDAGIIDRFSTALKDGAYLPLTFEVSDVGWSDRTPGNATANVNVTTNQPDAGVFTFPMEFTPHAGGWRLSQQTADLLLAFGTARAGTATSTAPSTAPTP